MKVFITKKIPSTAVRLLHKEGFDVQVNLSNKNLSRLQLINKCKHADAIISLLSDRFDREIIDQLSNCKIIANYAVGYNNIDIEYAKSKGIVVTNTPDVLTNATADVALTLMLMCSRRITEAVKLMQLRKFKGWEPELLLGIELNGKTLGIVGAGRIGQAAAFKAKAFGMKVIYFSKTRKQKFEREIGAKKTSLNMLLKKSDVVSIHLPLSEKTFHLFSKEKLDLLKPTSILINTSRGEVVDEQYLIKLLSTNKIFAAGFDVYENEPRINEKLFSLNNVVLLPHIGSGTIETRDKMAELAANNIIRVLKRKRPVTPV